MKDDLDFYRNVFFHYEAQNSFFKQLYYSSHAAFSLIAGREHTRKQYEAYSVYVFGCLMTIVKWVNEGMQEDIDFMAEILTSALPGMLAVYGI